MNSDVPQSSVQEQTFFERKSIYLVFSPFISLSLSLSLSFAIVLGTFRVTWNWIFSTPILTFLCNKWSTNFEKLFVSVSVIALWRIYLITNIVSFRSSFIKIIRSTRIFFTMLKNYSSFFSLLTTYDFWIPFSLELNGFEIEFSSRIISSPV